MSIMKFLFFIIFSFAFYNLGGCLDDETNKYLNCSSIQVSDCGGFDQFKYPFWGMGRPEYCGLPGFYLRCKNYSPIILIKDEEYRVLQVDQENKTMRILKPEFMFDSLTSTPFNNFTNIILDVRLFKYTETVVNTTYFYSCKETMHSLWNFTFNMLTKKRKFTVRDVLMFFATIRESSYLVLTELVIEIPRQNLPNCRYNLTVPVMKTNLGRRDNKLLDTGFEVSYDVAKDISNCKICEKSGGECGYDTKLKQYTCFCRDGRSTTTSARNGTTQRCSGRGDLDKKILIGTSAAVSSTLVLLLVVLVIFLKKKQRERTNDQQILEAFYKNQRSLSLKRYKYSDVKKMTSSFKEKLGQGGYGSVFKGKLHDDHPVAVKLLFTNSKNNGEEFINEVESISQTSHVNVVNLLGFCLEGKKRALIYEFMPNGSLEKFIYNKMPPLASGDHHPQLGGDILYQIAIGIANGLEYLHQGCNTRILHFDIKPHNILLDEEFCPKIADFGLAKLCTRTESMISFLGTRGTTGYIAPEVFSRNFGGVSYKSDVYSYGMMILEMVGGRKNIDVAVGMDHSSQLYYPHWIYERLKQNEDLGLHEVTITEASEEIARKMIIVGLWCIQANPINRPSMTKVLEMLEGTTETLQIPPKPFFSSPIGLSPVGSPTSISMSPNYSLSESQLASSSSVASMPI